MESRIFHIIRVQCCGICYGLYWGLDKDCFSIHSSVANCTQVRRGSYEPREFAGGSGPFPVGSSSGGTSTATGPGRVPAGPLC